MTQKSTAINGEDVPVFKTERLTKVYQMGQGSIILFPLNSMILSLLSIDIVRKSGVFVLALLLFCFINRICLNYEG